MKMTASRAICQSLARAGIACLLAAGAGALTAAGAVQAVAKAMPACPAAVVSGATATVTCSYTGAAEYWTVPAGVTQATFVLYGAVGGTNGDSESGGSGAEVTGTLPVTPGSVLQVNAGQAGTNSAAAFGGGGRGGGYGAGGGGASDIRDGTGTLADRLLVAGGGGGGGADGGGVYGGIAAGGAGGNADSPGGTGASAIGTCLETLPGGGGGGAGTTTMGGAGGPGSTSSCNGGNTTPFNGSAGSEGSGGAGGDYGGGGGGGGYYGGGGGAGYAWDEDAPESGAGGGGGGASYTGTATSASVDDDPASRPSLSGEVIISYRPVLAVTHHSLSGHETSVSCLTASRCVAVGSRGSHGVVVTLASGVQRSAAVLRGSSAIDSVSCRQSGCWAIGRPRRGSGAYLVKISSAGRLTAGQTVSVPAGTALRVISCASMTSCEVAGTDNRLRPAAIELGTWSGTRLRLYRVRVAGSTRLSVGGISCWRNDCEAVGSAMIGPAGTDLIVTTSGGKPAALNADSGYALSSISCISAARCYAAGAAVLVTVTNGVPADPQAVTGGWNGNAIECTGSACEAAGGEVFNSADADVLISLSDGTARAPVVVQTGQGFSGIAARGKGFIAIGTEPNGVGTEDTIG